MKDFKYFFSFTLPFLTFLGIYWGGVWAYSTFVFVFGVLSVAEHFLPKDYSNIIENKENKHANKFIFNLLIKIHLPLYYGILLFLGYKLQVSFYENYFSYSTFELVGLALSVGVYLGAIGINIAHELGHRTNRFDIFLAHLFLLPCYYMHFYVEHNKGHHLNVSTPNDPASARFKETVYGFYWRSLSQSYLSAWRISAKEVRQRQQPWFYNQILWYTVLEFLFVLAIVFLGGFKVALFIVLVGFIGALSLETVNYIEHYGLQRKALESGYYERVEPIHSWNSEHVLGRYILFELTRHSDHHYKSTRTYPILRYHSEAPQLPMGYPAAMLCALFPPLWFYIMNPKVEVWRCQFAHS